MTHADGLVAAYVRSGLAKIHPDSSYHCAEDVAGPRTAFDVADDPAVLRFAIGTEVPVPGGADHAIDALVPAR